MKRDHIFLGLSAALFFAVGMVTPDKDTGSEVYAQGTTNMSSNSTNSLSTNTTSTLAKGDKVTLKIEELTVTKSPTSVTDVIGKIRNNNTVSVNDVKLITQFFDKDGALLGKSDKFVSSESFVLKPGDVLPFERLEIVSFDRIKTSQIQAYGSVVK
jgi:exosome complex RNA-binding protein Rrp4